jgi:hypothetical protein
MRSRNPPFHVLKILPEAGVLPEAKPAAPEA